MDAAMTAALAARTTVVPDEPGTTSRVARAPRGAGTEGTRVEASAGDVAGWLAETGLDGSPISTAGAWIVRPSAAGGAARASGTSGYAAASSAVASGDWTFLGDASLSVEDKLALFMAAVQRKTDTELQRKMEEYRQQYTESASGSGSASGKDEGGSFLGTLLKILLPPLGLVDSLLGGQIEKFIGGALKTLGGPLLAALATALGVPWLAPVATKLGTALGDAVTKSAKASKPGSGSKAGSASTTAKKDGAAAKGSTRASGDKKADSPDERLALLEIQRLVDKQNQMFQLVSNLLKGMHETSLATIQNLR